MYVKVVPDIVPTTQLVPSFATDKFMNRLHIFRNREVSERSLVPEDSSTSHADTTKTKQQDTEQEEDSAKGFIHTLICTLTDTWKQSNYTETVVCGGEFAFKKELFWGGQNRKNTFFL